MSGARRLKAGELRDGSRAAVRIALAGNPNCGKTTVFNGYTGARQHVGNYPGVTVERKEGHLVCNGEPVALVDLPGAYSLTAYSQEELVARRELGRQCAGRHQRGRFLRSGTQSAADRADAGNGHARGAGLQYDG